MPDKLARSQSRIGLIVRLVCGAVIGLLIGFSWVFYFGAEGNPALNWTLFSAAVILCAVLAARFGDVFWTRILDWLD
jgi:uncharacterized protein YacL